MNEIILVGAGPMAIAYVEVLKALDQPFIVVGRSAKSALDFEEKTGIKPVVGGLRQFLESNDMDRNRMAIIATGTESLMESLLLLLKSGISKILIEKPAAISIEELIASEKDLLPFSDQIFVAYNRRFYASVIEAEKLIEEDGGLLTMHFEFTEWAHKIEPLSKASGVKENWFFANSTHVVDLAFFLAGEPKNWSSFSQEGTIDWHKKSNFAGAGVTEKEVLFSYISNWESAGRWALELLTRNRRIYLKPLEGIDIQLKGAVGLNPHEFDYELDKKFKPGVFKQVEAFVSSDTTRLISCREHIKRSKEVYSEILK